MTGLPQLGGCPPGDEPDAEANHNHWNCTPLLQLPKIPHTHHFRRNGPASGAFPLASDEILSLLRKGKFGPSPSEEYSAGKAAPGLCRVKSAVCQSVRKRPVFLRRSSGWTPRRIDAWNPVFTGSPDPFLQAVNRDLLLLRRACECMPASR